MTLVPESDEVVHASLDNLVEAVDMAEVLEDIEVAEDVLAPLFLKGGPFLIQHLVSIIGTIFSYMEVLEWDIHSFNFADLWDETSDAPILMDSFYWRSDEVASLVDSLFTCFKNHDVQSFRGIVSQSYFLGFGFFSNWFLPLVSTMAIIGDLGVNVLEGREEDHGSE